MSDKKDKHEDAKTKKIKWWKILLFIVLAVIIIAGSYVAYVFLTYSRIEDNQDLAVRNKTDLTAEPGVEYTAVSYNLGFGAYTADFTFFMDGGKESRARSEESVKNCISKTSKFALSYEPDLVLFQEIDTDSTRSFHVDEREILYSLFDEEGAYDSVFAENYHSAYLMYPLLKPHGASNSGLVTESRFDISSSLRRSLPIATDFNKILDLDRCYSISRIPVSNGKELVIINTHLSAYGTDADQGNEQLEMIFADMKAEYDKGNYVICGGDYNHDFTGNSREYFNPGNGDSFSWCQPFPDAVIPEGFSKCTDYDEGMVPSTRNTDIPYSEESFTVTLDGFIVSDNVTCTYVQNIDAGFEYTDHNPVVMKFILDEK